MREIKVNRFSHVVRPIMYQCNAGCGTFVAVPSTCPLCTTVAANRAKAANEDEQLKNALFLIGMGLLGIGVLVFGLWMVVRV